MKPTIAYHISDSAYLAHVMPIIQAFRSDYDHVIVSQLIKTCDLARELLNLKTFFCPKNEVFWQEMKQRAIRNIIFVHQKVGDTPPDPFFNTFQMFHGVSFKSKELHNWSPKKWSYVLVQALHYWDVYPQKFSEHIDRIVKSSFAREVYYDETVKASQKKYILYMPTHRDAGYDGLDNNLELVCRTIRTKLVVKLHPINLRNKAFLYKIKHYETKYPHVDFVGEDNYRYFAYHNLFANAEMLISDFSSVVCEFMLMDRPIVILRGGNRTKPVKQDWEHLSSNFFFVKHRNLEDAVYRARHEFKPGSYPQVYFKEPSIFNEIKTRLV